MARLEAVSYLQMEEAVRGILAKKRRTRCFLCGGEIEIRLTHRTPEPNPVAPLLKKMGFPEPRLGAREWYEVTALVCSQCGVELEPYEEIQMLNLGVTYGSLVGPREAYIGRDGKLKTRVPRRVSWERRRQLDLSPKVRQFHCDVQEWLQQNFRTCPDCGGAIDYRWESRLGEVETVYFDRRPDVIGFKLPPEPIGYDVVVSVFCRGRCRRKFAIPAEIEAMNKTVKEGARQTHRAPRPLAEPRKRFPEPSRRGEVVRIERMEDLECKCPNFCPRHTPIRAAVR